MPLPGYYIAGMGTVAISSQGLDNEVHLPGAAESDERVRNVLGLIGSYQMGAGPAGLVHPASRRRGSVPKAQHKRPAARARGLARSLRPPSSTGHLTPSELLSLSVGHVKLSSAPPGIRECDADGCATSLGNFCTADIRDSHCLAGHVSSHLVGRVGSLGPEGLRIISVRRVCQDRPSGFPLRWASSSPSRPYSRFHSSSSPPRYCRP